MLTPTTKIAHLAKAIIRSYNPIFQNSGTTSNTQRNTSGVMKCLNVHINRSTPVCESVSRLTVSLHHMAVGVAHGMCTDVRSARRLTGDWSRQVRPIGGRGAAAVASGARSAERRRGVSEGGAPGSRHPRDSCAPRTLSPFCLNCDGESLSLFTCSSPQTRSDLTLMGMH